MGMPGISNPGYVTDIYVRPQGFSANLRENGMDLNNKLRGISSTRIHGGSSGYSIDNDAHPLRPSHNVSMGIINPRIEEPTWETRNREAPDRRIDYSPINRRPLYLDRAPSVPINTRQQFIDHMSKRVDTVRPNVDKPRVL